MNISMNNTVKITTAASVTFTITPVTITTALYYYKLGLMRL